MADALTFQLALIDKLSGPASIAEKSLKALEDVLNRIKAIELPKLAFGPIKLPKVPKATEDALPKVKPPADNTAALKANAEAMAHENAKLAPSLIAPLRLAEGELERLKTQLRDDKLAVTNLSASMRQLQQATVVDINAFKLLQAQLQEKKNSLAQVQQKLIMSGNAARFGSEGTNRLTTTLRELAEKAGVVPGTMGGLAKKLGEVAGQADTLIDTLGPTTAVVAGLGAAAIAAVAAVIALGGAFLYAAIGGGKLALEAAQAKQDTTEMLEAILGSQQAALETYDAIEDITRDIGISQAHAQELAQSLTAAGISNRNMLEDSLKAIATADAVIKGSGEKIQAIIERATTSGKFEINAKKLTGTGVQVQALYQQIAASTGKGVKQVEAQLKAGKISAEIGIAALTKVIDTKFGGVARQRARGFDESLQRMKDNIGRLFEDVHIDAFEESLAKIVDLFDTSTVSGQALKEILTGTFSGLFDAVAKAEPYVSIFLRTLILMALKVYNAFRPVLAQFHIFGSDGAKDQKSLIDRMISLAAGVGVLASMVATLVGWLGKLNDYFPILKVGLGLLLGPFLIGPAMVAKFIASLVGLGLTIAGLIPGWITAGEQLVDGLVQGVKSAGSRAIAAVKALGTDALNAFKSVFEIHSPSKVMTRMGGYLSLGLAQGIDAKAPAANDNMRDLLASPTPLPQPRDRDSGRSKGNGMSITFAEGAIQINGVEGAEQLADIFPQLFADAFEKLALKQASGF